VTGNEHGPYSESLNIRASSCFKVTNTFPVKSIGFTSSSTGRASVGVMAEGEYTFGTAEAEEMTVVSGALNVLLPGETEWKVYAAGEAFNVPGHSEFHLQVAEPTSYLCRYLK
jgi:uncharacterized protein YaiE (UPF0345 family)